MHPSSNHAIETMLGTPLGRRAVLALGARAAYLLTTTLGLGAATGLLQSLAGCQRAPGTAREQFIYFSEEKEMAMGLSAFREVLRQAPLSGNPELNEMVHRVGDRIAKAANKPEYQWEFAVIQDDRTINAFALP
ncbi:MAG: M48 family metalloprotease, partial [Nitrospira sp.]